MKYYTFASEFIDAIWAGQKVSTIRREAKVREGETFGLRRVAPRMLFGSQQEQIGTASAIVVHDFRIKDEGGRWRCVWPDVSNGMYLDCDKIARNEGFGKWIEMRDWFVNHYGLPFEGVLTYWGDTFKEVE